MKLLALYLKEFNRDYLSSPADRLRTWGIFAEFWTIVAAIVLVAVFMRVAMLFYGLRGG
ncbi:MAG: hypothetical protein ACYC6G_14055 [Desulfobaccales bacterium]